MGELGDWLPRNRNRVSGRRHRDLEDLGRPKGVQLRDLMAAGNGAGNKARREICALEP